MLDIKGLNIPEEARNELAGFVQERLTYAFAIFPISGILVVVTLVVYGAGYMLRSACYCLFGRGNVSCLTADADLVLTYRV